MVPYLCDGVAHLLAGGHHRRNIRLLVLIGGDKTEAAKQLVCVCAGREAGRVWTEWETMVRGIKPSSSSGAGVCVDTHMTQQHLYSYVNIININMNNSVYNT